MANRATTRKSTRSSKPTFNQFFYGLLIGLSFGIIISALIVWMINSKNLPKKESVRSEDALNKLIDNCNNVPNKNTVLVGDNPPAFDFYNKEKFQPSKIEPNIDSIIAGSLADNSSNEKNKVVQEEKKNKKAEVVDVPKPKEVQPAKDVTKVKQSVTLRSKSYAKLDEVEEIKARLALIGFEPKVKKQKDKYYLDLGTYKNTVDANAVKKELGELSKIFTIE